MTPSEMCWYQVMTRLGPPDISFPIDTRTKSIQNATRIESTMRRNDLRIVTQKAFIGILACGEIITWLAQASSTNHDLWQLGRVPSAAERADKADTRQKSARLQIDGGALILNQRGLGCQHFKVACDATSIALIGEIE